MLEPRVPPRFLPGVQVVEYLRSFLYGRLGWNRLGGNLIISGAFGLFRKDYLLEIGGYRTNSIVEDFDVVVRLHRLLRDRKHALRDSLRPRPRRLDGGAGVERGAAPTAGALAPRADPHDVEVPRHAAPARAMVASAPRLPFFIFGEMIAPVVELLGYAVTAIGLWLGALDVPFALLFLLVALSYGMILSIWGIVLEEIGFRRYRRWGDLGRLLLFAMLENFGYRQLTVWFRLRAFWSAMRYRRTWGRMTRTGFAPAGTGALLMIAALLRDRRHCKC